MAKAAEKKSPLEGEVRRAALEIRGALGLMAQEERLPPALLSLCTLMDRVSIGILFEEGESAFVLDEPRRLISFRHSVVQRTWDQTGAFGAQVGTFEADELLRIQQMAVNMLVLHELMHVQQNFPSFGMVAKIKLGMRGLGLPMLDVAADTVAAWVCARVEFERLELEGEKEFLQQYVNCLVLGYVIGAFVFNVVGRREKMQRALGLLLSAALVQYKVMGLLDPETLYPNWDPLSPIMAFDIEAAGAFNAFVIDRVPGLLVEHADKVSGEVISQIWQGLGVAPVEEMLELIGRAFSAIGVIRPSAND